MSPKVGTAVCGTARTVVWDCLLYTSDNLGVAKGELIGLVGNNGAGKTTLLRLILDLIQADDGCVESNGQKVNESETWKEYTGDVYKRQAML